MVYLPTLLLLPDGYRWPLIGHFSFHEAAIIPIAVWFVMSSSRTWEFSMTDLLVLGYCAVTVISQYHNRNFEDARNTALRDATYIVFPYMLAKGLCRRGNFGLKVAKQIAILLSIVSIVSIYEFKMAVDPFESLVRPFFSVTGPVTTFRYGLTRVSGPFGHALLAGVILLVGYRLARWVEWSGCWQKRFPILGIDAVRCCELCIVAGAAMTVARGAWTGAIAGSLVVLLGRARNRVWAMTTMIAMVVLVGLALTGTLWWLLSSGDKPQPTPVHDSVQGSSTGGATNGEAAVNPQAPANSSAAANTPVRLPASDPSVASSATLSKSAVSTATPVGPTAAPVTPAVASAAVPTSTPRPKDGELILKFSSDSWAEVYDAAGQRLFYDVGTASSAHTVKGPAPMRVVLGNAAGVALEFNGRPALVPANVRPDGSVRFVINAHGRAAPGHPADDGD